MVKKKDARHANTTPKGVVCTRRKKTQAATVDSPISTSKGQEGVKSGW